MNQRISLAIGVTALLAVAACGDDDVPATADTAAPDTEAPDTEAPDTAAPDTEAPDTEAPDTEAPGTDAPTDSPDGAGYEHPTGADEAIVSVSYPGGFTTPRYAFSQVASPIISGDGQVYTGAAVPAIFPGPLVWPMQVQTISEDGIQAVLAAADDAGLFAEIDYEDESTQLIADAPTTLVTITAEGQTWQHSAYALGFATGPDGEVEQSAEREALQGFVDSLSDLAGLVGAENLGEQELYAPDTYDIVATPIDDISQFASDGIEPTVVEWPTEESVSLADASTCTVIDAAFIGELLENSTELTFFSEGDITYEVWARPTLPGRGCDT